MTRKRPIILDGDPGHDDAIAFVLAASYSDELDIRAITAVGGNQTLAKTTYNYRRIATLLNRTDIPIAAGRDKPLMCDLVIAPNFHGESGLDGPVLPEPKVELVKENAVELMAKTIRESDEEVTIVATGPQTNVASLLLAHPELKEKIDVISIMGGGLVHGNWSPAAEFNILVDPEAADIEFKSGVPIMMSGLDVTEKAMVMPNEWEEIRKIDNPVAKVVAGWFDFFFIHLKELGFEGAAIHDACAVMALVHPEIFDIKEYYVEIETQGAYCRGATVPDYYDLTGKKHNCKCLVGIDRDAFAKEIYNACLKFNNMEVK